MKNEKANCIFEHADFIYVINFDKMICWVVQDEDQEDPVSTLSVKHTGPSEWWYRYLDVPSDTAYTRDLDASWCEKAEAAYAQYIIKIIVGNRKRQRKTTSQPHPQ